MFPQPNPAPVAASTPLYLPVAGSPPLDAWQRASFENEWRSCMTRLRFLAEVLGYEDRLPNKQR